MPDELDNHSVQRCFLIEKDIMFLVISPKFPKRCWCFKAWRKLFVEMDIAVVCANDVPKVVLANENPSFDCRLPNSWESFVHVSSVVKLHAFRIQAKYADWTYSKFNAYVVSALLACTHLSLESQQRRKRHCSSYVPLTWLHGEGHQSLALS